MKNNKGERIMRTIGTLLMVVSMSLILLGIPVIHYTGNIELALVIGSSGIIGLAFYLANDNF
jgi:ABC-type multidrug transport system permease subunit